MSVYQITWRSLLVSFCFIFILPAGQARQAYEEQPYGYSQPKGSHGRQDRNQPSQKQRYTDPSPQYKTQPPKYRAPKQQTNERATRERPRAKTERRETHRQREQQTTRDQRRAQHADSTSSRDNERKRRHDEGQYQDNKRSKSQERDKREKTRTKKDGSDSTRNRDHRSERERHTERRSDNDRRRDQRTDREHRQPRPQDSKSRDRQHRTDRDHARTSSSIKQRYSSHDNYYRRYHTSKKHRYNRHYHRHETYRYHTHYLAPIRYHYHHIGYHVRVLPRSYITVFVSGLPYFYFSGVFYRHHLDGYVVVRAPIGAYIDVLPVGFISFQLSGIYYYYVNDTYYLWDNDLETYIVVAKPYGAEKAIEEATSGRLFVYPNEGQSEEQQATDRYECHRWAVHETGIDPTLEDQDVLTRKEERDYKRALTACLEGRGYTVK